MKCFDCEKETKDFRCDKCYQKAERGELHYEDTTKFSRIHHLGSYEWWQKKKLAEAMNKPSVIKQRNERRKRLS